MTQTELQEILSYNCQPIVAARQAKRGYMHARVIARKTLEDVLYKLRNIQSIADYKVVMRMPVNKVTQSQSDKLTVIALVWNDKDELTVAQMVFT